MISWSTVHLPNVLPQRKLRGKIYKNIKTRVQQTKPEYPSTYVIVATQHYTDVCYQMVIPSLICTMVLNDQHNHLLCYSHGTI